MGAVSKPGGPVLSLNRVTPNDLKKIIQKMEHTAQLRMRRTCQDVHKFMAAFVDIIPTQPEDLQLRINLCEKQNEPEHVTLIWIIDGVEKEPISYPEAKLADLTHAFRFYKLKKLVLTCEGGSDDLHVANFTAALEPAEWFAFQLCIHTGSHDVIFDFCRYLVPVAVELNVYRPRENEDYKAENIYIRLAMYRGCKTCAFITNNSSYPPIGQSTDCLIEHGGFPPEMRQNWSYSIVDSTNNNEEIEVAQGRYSPEGAGNYGNNEQLDL